MSGWPECASTSISAELPPTMRPSLCTQCICFSVSFITSSGKALATVWNRAVERAGLPHIGLYEGTKHTMATDAIRRGVPERHLQRFLGHASVESTRRYARLADNALLEVLRRPEVPASDKRATRVRETKLSKIEHFNVGPPGFEPGT